MGIEALGAALFGGLVDVGAGVAAGAEGLAAGVGEAAAGIGTGLAETAGAVGTGLAETAGAVGAGLGELGTGIATGVGEIGTGIGTGLGELGTGLASGLQTVGSTVAGGFENLFSGVGGSLGDILGTGGDPLAFGSATEELTAAGVPFNPFGGVSPAEVGGGLTGGASPIAGDFTALGAPASLDAANATFGPFNPELFAGNTADVATGGFGVDLGGALPSTAVPAGSIGTPSFLDLVAPQLDIAGTTTPFAGGATDIATELGLNPAEFGSPALAGGGSVPEEIAAEIPAINPIAPEPTLPPPASFFTPAPVPGGGGIGTGLNTLAGIGTGLGTALPVAGLAGGGLAAAALAGGGGGGGAAAPAVAPVGVSFDAAGNPVPATAPPMMSGADLLGLQTSSPMDQSRLMMFLQQQGLTPEQAQQYLAFINSRLGMYQRAGITDPLAPGTVFA